MRIVVKSRDAAERSNDLTEPHVIISIKCAHEDMPVLATNQHTAHVERLSFDDLDRMPEKGTAAYDYFRSREDHAMDGPMLFSAKMAHKIIQILRLYEGHALIVHCGAGVSRSAGMAAAIDKHYNGSDFEFFKALYRPNMLVYRTMLEALNAPVYEGFEAGEPCNRPTEAGRCDGVIEERDIEGCCSCHCGIPPCGYCTTPKGYCPKCDWVDEGPE